MLAFSGCDYGGGEKERNELGTLRKRWKTLHVRFTMILVSLFTKFLSATTFFCSLKTQKRKESMGNALSPLKRLVLC